MSANEESGNKLIRIPIWNALSTHTEAAAVVWTSRAIVGSATFAIVWSIMVTNTPIPVTATAQPRREVGKPSVRSTRSATATSRRQGPSPFRGPASPAGTRAFFDDARASYRVVPAADAWTRDQGRFGKYPKAENAKGKLMKASCESARVSARAFVCAAPVLGLADEPVIAKTNADKFLRGTADLQKMPGDSPFIEAYTVFDLSHAPGVAAATTLTETDLVSFAP